MTNESIYERYCRLRDLKGYTDAQVSRETGISKPTLSDWKSGRSTPKAAKLKKIADFLEVSLDYLQDGEEEEENPYYLNEETRKMAQFLFEHPGHRVLLDASRNLQPEDLEAIVNIVNRMNQSDV